MKTLPKGQSAVVHRQIECGTRQAAPASVRVRLEGCRQPVVGRVLGALPCLASAVLAVCATFMPQADAQLFDARDLSGAELFGRYCAACHGPEAAGDGPVAPTLRNQPPDLRRLEQRADGEFPAGRVRETIDGRAVAGAHGTREMPIWGYEFWVEEGADATAEQDAREIIDRIVEFLASVQLSQVQQAEFR